MENGVIIYIEDSECGNVRIHGKVIGNPGQSKELADGILVQLMAETHRQLHYLTPESLQ
jgi:hypothetical protein